MKIKNIGIIIRREYLNRVKKKSFLITTFLVPLLLALCYIVPVLLILNSKDKMKFVAVVDQSGIVYPTLESNETVFFADCSDRNVDSIKVQLEQMGYDAVLYISPLDTAAKTLSSEITSQKPLGLDLSEKIGRYINDAVESYRIASYKIDGLNEILEDVKADIKLRTFTIDEDGKESVSESGVYVAISLILGFLVYIFIALFGGTVMSAVIEEKASRVIEVLVSSVKATELMFGKIIGVALVATTQFILWVVLTIAIIAGAGSVLGQKVISGISPEAGNIVGSMGSGSSAMTSVVGASGEMGEFAVVLSTLQNLPIAKILVAFLVFFILGYMLYASMFAAIGSAVETQEDTSQLQLPVTIPLMIGYFLSIYSFNAPDSGITFWASMVPFTSPIVMLARLPFGVQTWEIVLSAAILLATVILFAWLSAKIYKVGILMFGKKSTWKDLWKWLRQD